MNQRGICSAEDKICSLKPKTRLPVFQTEQKPERFLVQPSRKIMSDSRTHMTPLSLFPQLGEDAADISSAYGECMVCILASILA